MRQKFIPGSVVKIELSEEKLAYGRLLPGIASRISVYDFITAKDEALPAIETIINQPILFYCGLYRTIITKGFFEIIGYKELKENEIRNIPPSFNQDLMNIDDCVISWFDGSERKATPQECIGLERSSVWDEEGIKKRIEDHYNQKKNFHVELDKVILSKEDPRYLSGTNLKWDFDKQEFYRTD